VAFDAQDDLLYGTSYTSTRSTSTNGLVAGPVSLSYTASPAAGSYFSVDFVGRDTAGDIFARVDVGDPGIDFGAGPVTGYLVLHYTTAGAFFGSFVAPDGTMALGALGHLFTANQVTGTVDYGCGTVGATGVTRTVVTEYDATLACLWSKALPAATVFAVDPLENVMVATTFAGTVDFGAGPLASVGTSDLALAEFDAAGDIAWSESFGASGASVSGISALGATAAGGATLSVTLEGSVDFGCGAVSSSAGATTLFASFDAAGAIVYSRVVELVAGVDTPVVDGLGGVSVAAQVPAACPPTSCGTCSPDSTCTVPWDVVVSRFAP